MIVGRGRKPELREDAADVRLDGLRADHELLADAVVRAALRHQAEHFALARAEIGERILFTTAAEKLAYDLRVDGRAAVRHAPHRVEELVDLEHAVFQQVTEPLGPLAEEPERVRIIDASGTPEEVTRRLLAAIQDLLP